MEIVLKNVGNRIKSIRNQFGLNQGDFAKLVDATLPAVSNWENGRNLPNKERLKKIAELGNKTVDFLLYGSFYDAMLDKNNKYFPMEYQHIVGFTPWHIMQEAYEFIEENEISISNETMMRSIANKIVEQTIEDIQKTSEQEISYILKNLNNDEIFKKFDRFLQKDNPSFFINYKSSKNFVNQLKKINSFEEIAENFGLINSVFDSLKMVVEDKFFIEEVRTAEVRLSEFIDNEYFFNHQEPALYSVGVKFSSTSPIIKNVKKISTLSVYDDLLTQKVYIIPNYINGYQEPYQHQHTHFIIYNNRIHTSILQNDRTVEINKQMIQQDEVDFIAPLLSIIY